MILKVLIVGLGNIGLLYDLNKKRMQLTHASAFFKNKSFKIVGGVDKSKKILRIFKKKFKSRGFTKLESALKNLQPDVIVVSTNTKNHLEIINKIFLHKSNCKFIICEKPCGQSLNEIIKINRISKKNKCKIYVNYMRSSSKHALYLKKFASTQKNYFKGISYYTNGVLNDASHYINLFQFMFGKIIRIKNDIYKSQNSKLNDFTLFFKNGEVKFIRLNNVKYNNSKFEIYFQKNMVYYNSDHNTLKIFNITRNKIYNNKILNNKSSNFFDLEFEKIQSNVVSQVLKMMKKKYHSLVEIEDAIETMKVIKKLK